MISAARSRNIRFTLVVQNNSQLQRNYGPELAETIKANCLNWVFLNSKEMPLLEQLVQLGGTIHGRDADGGEHVVTLEALNALNKSWDGAEAVIFLNRSSPFMTVMPDISKYAFPSYPPVHLEQQVKEFHSFNILSDVLDRYSAQQIVDAFCEAENIASPKLEDGEEPIGDHVLPDLGEGSPSASGYSREEDDSTPFSKPHKGPKE